MTDHEYELLSARVRQIINPGLWRRSGKGNLWRKRNDLTLSVFGYRDAYKWCVSSGEEDQTFSPHLYDSEEDALEALGWYLVENEL